MACCPDWVAQNKKAFNETIEKASNDLLNSDNPQLRDTALKVTALLRHHQLLGYLNQDLTLTNKTAAVPAEEPFESNVSDPRENIASSRVKSDPKVPKSVHKFTKPSDFFPRKNPSAGIAEKTAIQTNRFLYASHTSFGRPKLNGEMKGKQGETHNLIFQGVSDEAMKAFGQFLRDDQLPNNLSKEPLLELLEMTHCYFIKGLAEAAENGLVNFVRKEENLKEINKFLELSLKNDLTGLKRACFERLENYSKGTIKLAFSPEEGSSAGQITLSILADDLNKVPIDLRAILPLCTTLEVSPTCLLQLKTLTLMTEHLPIKNLNFLKTLCIKYRKSKNAELSKIKTSSIFRNYSGARLATQSSRLTDG